MSSRLFGKVLFPVRSIKDLLFHLSDAVNIQDFDIKFIFTTAANYWQFL